MVCNGFWDGKPCDRIVIHARGKCYRCYKEFVSHCKANGSFAPYDKELDERIQREHWVYEGDEQALIEMTERLTGNEG